MEEIKGNRNGIVIFRQARAKSGTHKVHDSRAYGQRMVRDDRYCFRRAGPPTNFWYRAEFTRTYRGSIISD